MSAIADYACTVVQVYLSLFWAEIYVRVMSLCTKNQRLLHIVVHMPSSILVDTGFNHGIEGLTDQLFIASGGGGLWQPLWILFKRMAV